MSHSDSTTALPESGAGWSGLISGKNAIYSVTLAGSVALHAVNVFVATTIMPSVVQDIGGLDYYAWSTTLFVVASILGAALSARLLNAAGPRGAYLAAAGIFAIGTLICALAPAMPFLLGGRFIQGLGGGFLYALAYAVIRMVFEPTLWGRAIGLISAMWGLATLTGPALGGMFAEIGQWRAAFWTLIPLITGFAALAAATLPARAQAGDGASRLPKAQLCLLTLAVLVLSAGSVGSAVAVKLAGIGGALAAIALLVYCERRSLNRLLPDGALNPVGPLGGCYAAIGLLVLGMQPEIFVPYLLQVLHGQSPLIAGYLAALMALGWTLGTMVSAGLGEVGGRRAVLAGPLSGLCGLILLAVLAPQQSDGAWMILGPVCIGLVLVGFGIGLAWPHIVTGVFRFAPDGQQDLATAGITTVQLFATAFGAAAAGMVVNLAGLTEPGGIAGAQSAALWLFAAFAAAPVLCLVLRFYGAGRKVS